MDLFKIYPRSPKFKMAGLVQLARMINKTRAFRENKIADYIYPCPLDKVTLNFLCIDFEAFTNKATDSKDEEINAWAQETIKNKNAVEIEFVNDQVLERRPES